MLWLSAVLLKWFLAYNSPFDMLDLRIWLIAYNSNPGMLHFHILIWNQHLKMEMEYRSLNMKVLIAQWSDA